MDKYQQKIFSLMDDYLSYYTYKSTYDGEVRIKEQRFFSNIGFTPFLISESKDFKNGYLPFDFVNDTLTVCWYDSPMYFFWHKQPAIASFEITKDGVTWEKPVQPENLSEELKEKFENMYVVPLDFSAPVKQIRFTFVHNVADPYILNLRYVGSKEDENEPFIMPITNKPEAYYGYGYDFNVTGKVESGCIHVGDNAEVVSDNRSRPYSVSKITVSGHPIDFARTGDTVTISVSCSSRINEYYTKRAKYITSPDAFKK